MKYYTKLKSSSHIIESFDSYEEAEEAIGRYNTENGEQGTSAEYEILKNSIENSTETLKRAKDDGWILRTRTVKEEEETVTENSLQCPNCGTIIILGDTDIHRIREKYKECPTCETTLIKE